jgi:hypothetical protein
MPQYVLAPLDTVFTLNVLDLRQKLAAMQKFAAVIDLLKSALKERVQASTRARWLVE